MKQSIRIPLAAAALVALAGCGGVVKFSGNSAVAGTPPAAARPAMSAAQGIQRVKFLKDRIEITEKIQFEGGKATILPASGTLLEEIAKTITENQTSIKKLEIQGHASSEGNKDTNKRLSEERAKAVQAALLKIGVKPEILSAKGYGSEKMIANPEKTDEDREKNRRVEFVVTK